MCNCFKEIQADYQVTDKIEKIDIARILRENKEAGCQYVFILTNKDFAVFMTKKFSSRLDALGLMEIQAVEDEGSYGLMTIEDGSSVSGVATYVPGNVIRSTGFVNYVSGVTCNYKLLKNILDNIDLIEEKFEEDRLKEISNMSVVKILAG